MKTAAELKEATDLWWLSEEEIEHYCIDRQPERRRDYLSLRAFHKRMRYDINDKHQWVILENKWFFAHFCEGAGLPHPRVYGVLANPQGMLADGGILRSVSDLVAWCRRTGATRFVLKPVAGGASIGIFVVEHVEWDEEQPTFFVVGRGPLSVQDLADQLVTHVTRHESTEGVLLQELAEPHRWFSKHNLGPFNIVRILTFVPDSGDPVVQASILYSGRVGQTVNEWRNGALSINVDITTGTLGTGRTLPKFGRVPFSAHPDTATVFEGLVLPDWQDAINLALRASRITLGMRLVCWEILLTDKGPQLLEGNFGFGLTSLQVHSEGFLKNGVAEMWKQAGADLPDGTKEWVKRANLRKPLLTRIRRKARRIVHFKVTDRLWHKSKGNLGSGLVRWLKNLRSTIRG